MAIAEPTTHLPAEPAPPAPAVPVAQTAYRLTTRVGPGHRIEFTAPDVPEGQTVELWVFAPRAPVAARRPALEVIQSLGGHRLFPTAREADEALQRERDAWER